MTQKLVYSRQDLKEILRMVGGLGYCIQVDARISDWLLEKRMRLV